MGRRSLAYGRVGPLPGFYSSPPPSSVCTRGGRHQPPRSVSEAARSLFTFVPRLGSVFSFLHVSPIPASPLRYICGTLFRFIGGRRRSGQPAAPSAALAGPVCTFLRLLPVDGLAAGYAFSGARCSLNVLPATFVLSRGARFERRCALFVSARLRFICARGTQIGNCCSSVCKLAHCRPLFNVSKLLG